MSRKSRKNEAFDLPSFQMMLKQLLSKKLINETEYQVIQKRLMKDYGIVSNITA